MSEPRYRLFVTVEIMDHVVTIAAPHRTKDSLRTAWALAKTHAARGNLASGEAWDTRDTEKPLASFGSPITARKRQRKPKKTKEQKNVVQQDNTRGKPRKRPRA